MNLQGQKYQQKSKSRSSAEPNYLCQFEMRYPVAHERPGPPRVQTFKGLYRPPDGLPELQDFLGLLSNSQFCLIYIERRVKVALIFFSLSFSVIFQKMLKQKQKVLFLLMFISINWCVRQNNVQKIAFCGPCFILLFCEMVLYQSSNQMFT